MTVEIIKGTEGKLWLDDDVVGRVATVSVRLENELDSYFEIGDRDAVETYTKNRKISGSLERAMINGVLIAKTLGKETASGSVYTISAEDLVNPETTVSGESISADDLESVFELAHKPPINGTVTIKRDGSEWGTEGVDYVVDYENGYIAFASPPSTTYTWTDDYHYGRSYTLTFVLQIGDGTHQRTDVTVGGVLFDTQEFGINNTGDVIMESLDYTAKSIFGYYLGKPTGV